MGYDESVYYHPEAFGLRVIGELNDPEADYSFHMFVVWKHEETGKIYYARDAGCSCPSPFEDYRSLDSLSEVVSLFDFIDSVEEYFESVARYANGYGNEDDSSWNATFKDNKWNNFKADCLDLIQVVRVA